MQGLTTSSNTVYWQTYCKAFNGFPGESILQPSWDCQLISVGITKPLSHWDTEVNSSQSQLHSTTPFDRRINIRGNKIPMAPFLQTITTFGIPVTFLMIRPIRRYKYCLYNLSNSSPKRHSNIDALGGIEPSTLWNKVQVEASEPPVLVMKTLSDLSYYLNCLLDLRVFPCTY